MNICPNCDAPNDMDAQFCHNCGFQLLSDELIDKSDIDDTGYTAFSKSIDSTATFKYPNSFYEFDARKIFNNGMGILYSRQLDFFLLNLLTFVLIHLCVGTIIGILFLPIVSAGYSFTLLRYFKYNLPIRLSDLCTYGWSYWASMFYFSLVAYILCLIGFVLLFIPGLMLTFAFMIASYQIVDKNSSGSEAISLALEIFGKYTAKLFYLSLRVLLNYLLVAMLILPLMWYTKEQSQLFIAYACGLFMVFYIYFIMMPSFPVIGMLIYMEIEENRD